MAKAQVTKRRRFTPPKGRNGKPCGLCKRLGKRCRWHHMAQKAHSRARVRAKQDEFLLAFAKVATVTRAARAAGIGRRTHYNWMATDPEYAARFEDARAVTVDELEFAMRRIALGHEHLPSAFRAQQALLRANCPERFGDRVQIEPAPSGGVEFTGIEYVIVDPKTDAEISRPQDRL